MSPPTQHKTFLPTITNEFSTRYCIAKKVLYLQKFKSTDSVLLLMKTFKYNQKCIFYREFDKKF